jgi:enterobactin synthetase component D
VLVALDVAFDLSLEHGRCVGVTLPDLAAGIDELAEGLLPAERAFAADFTNVRRRTWIGGRMAMRQALLRARLEAPAVLSDARGAPALPEGIAGSISHKARLAVALVAREPVARLGVDVEDDVVGTVDIARRVLTDGELDELASLPPEARAREVLLRFSGKEALYKALDPFVQRYVAFREVSLSTRPEGTTRVALHLSGGEGPFSVDVRWQRLDSIVLTTARVMRAA